MIKTAKRETEHSVNIAFRKKLTLIDVFLSFKKEKWLSYRKGPNVCVVRWGSTNQNRNTSSDVMEQRVRQGGRERRDPFGEGGRQGGGE